MRHNKGTHKLSLWLKSVLHGLEGRSPELASAVEAGRAFGRDNLHLPASYFAYNTFLAIFPLLLLISSVLGFVLAGNPGMHNSIMDSILRNFPGASGPLNDLVNSIVANRALVGVFGLVLLIWAGLRIPKSLEIGFDRVWPAPHRPFLKRKLLALWVLVVVGLLGSVTIAANLLTSSMLEWTTRHVGGILTLLVFLLGVILSLAANFVIFFVIFRIVPQRRLSPRSVAWGSAAGAVMFWLSEYIFNFYFVSISKTQILYGTIGALLGVMIWLYVLGYIVFYSAEIVALGNRP